MNNKVGNSTIRKIDVSHDFERVFMLTNNNKFYTYELMARKQTASLILEKKLPPEFSNQGKMTYSRFAIDNLHKFLVVGGSFGIKTPPSRYNLQDDDSENVIPFIRVYEINSDVLGIDHSFLEVSYNYYTFCREGFGHLKLVDRGHSNQSMLLIAANEISSLMVLSFSLKEKVLRVIHFIPLLHLGKGDFLKRFSSSCLLFQPLFEIL